MKHKTVILSVATGVSMFLIGWVCCLAKTKYNAGAIKTSDADITKNSCNFAKSLQGRFVMKDAQHAGFDFMSESCVLWINEMDNNHPDTLKLKWLNRSTFFTCDTKRYQEECPPRVSIYEIIFFNEKQLVLKDIWTGWNEFKDEILVFNKSDKL